MATTAALLSEHPTNYVYNTDYVTQSDKAWARDYCPNHNLLVHTSIDRDGLTHADFETPFLPRDHDDDLRLGASALPPNQRAWHLQSDADCELWFHSEISNIVLAAWNQYPAVTQPRIPSRR
jgi:hypothetical protein